VSLSGFWGGGASAVFGVGAVASSRLPRRSFDPIVSGISEVIYSTQQNGGVMRKSKLIHPPDVESEHTSTPHR